MREIIILFEVYPRLFLHIKGQVTLGIGAKKGPRGEEAKWRAVSINGDRDKIAPSNIIGAKMI